MERISGIKSQKQKKYIYSMVDSNGAKQTDRQTIADVFADFYADLYKMHRDAPDLLSYSTGVGIPH